MKFEHCWGILEESFFFFYILFSFWQPVKTPWDNICRKLVFTMKAQGEKHSIVKEDLSPWIYIVYMIKEA